MPSPLQNFKAKCVVGARSIFTAKWCPTPTIRTITEVKSRGVGFTHPFKDGTSYLTLPKATEITEPTPGRFVIAFTDMAHQALTYDFNVPA